MSGPPKSGRTRPRLNASWELQRVLVDNEHGHLSCSQGGRSCRRRRCGDRDGADRVAPGGVCVQAAPLGAVAQSPGPAGEGKQRLRVEALLAAAASTRTHPGPRCDPGRRPVPGGSAAPARPAWAGGPVFARRGPGRPAPDPDPSVVAGWPRRAAAGAGPWQQRQAVRLWLVDWRDGGLDFELADAQRWAGTITPAQVLSQIGSPFALDQQPPAGEELNHAA
jgi:hypothetical protein